MYTQPWLCASDPSAARLLIHAEEPCDAIARLFGSQMRRLRALYAGALRTGKRAPLTIRIDDARGEEVFALEHAGPLVDVALPAGTYHVTARLGGLRRSYTMALEQGTSLDLYLRLASDR